MPHLFLQGLLGDPPGGYPEPLRTRILRGQPPLYTSRPGADMAPLDYDALRAELEAKHGPQLRHHDVISASLYPKVFDEFQVRFSLPFRRPSGK